MYHHFLAFPMKRRNEVAAVALVGIIQHPKHMLERVQNPLSQVFCFNATAVFHFSLQ
jgi:hypothetical protein